MLFSPIRTQIVCFLFLLFGFTAFVCPQFSFKTSFTKKSCILAFEMHFMHLQSDNASSYGWPVETFDCSLENFFQALLETWKPKCSPQIVFMEIIPRLLAKFRKNLCGFSGWLVLSYSLSFLEKVSTTKITR